MIISHEHKFIFLKTEKTGSSSVESALGPFCGPRDILTVVHESDEVSNPVGPRNDRVLLGQVVAPPRGVRRVLPERSTS